MVQQSLGITDMQTMNDKNSASAKKYKKLTDNLYEVTSFSDPNKKYTVDYTNGSCDCPFYTVKQMKCKHIVFLENTFKKGTETKAAPKKDEWQNMTKLGYKFDEVTSAMFKMIRAGKEYEACFWAYTLNLSGYHNYLWRRITISSTEDCSSDPQAAMLIHSLRENYKFFIESFAKEKQLDMRKSIEANSFIFQAVCYLANTKKSRKTDTLANLIEEETKAGKRIAMPEIAKDPHTAAGKEKYGGWWQEYPMSKKEKYELWVNVWMRSTNEEEIPYLVELAKVWGIELKNDKPIKK